MIESALYERGIELLERIVAMLTKLIDSGSSTASITLTASFPLTSAATTTGLITFTITSMAGHLLLGLRGWCFAISQWC